MFAQLSEIIKLHPNNFIVTSQNDTHGSFINNYLIYSHLNQSSTSRVILILVDKPYIHYKSIHSKLGQKLDEFIKNKRLIIINGLKSYSTNAKLYNEIKDHLEILKSNTNISNLILIDNISPLLFMGESLYNIINLINYITLHINENTSVSIFTITLEEDQESKVFLI